MDHCFIIVFLIFFFYLKLRILTFLKLKNVRREHEAWKNKEQYHLNWKKNRDEVKTIESSKVHFQAPCLRFSWLFYNRRRVVDWTTISWKFTIESSVLFILLHLQGFMNSLELKRDFNRRICKQVLVALLKCKHKNTERAQRWCDKYNGSELINLIRRRKVTCQREKLESTKKCHS